MINTQRRSGKLLDMAAFDDSAVKSASQIIDMFKKKNKRVLKIFQDSDSEEESAGKANGKDDHSFGLRALSSADERTIQRSNSDKENPVDSQRASKMSTKSKGMLHIRNLSPADINVAPTEQIQEPAVLPLDKTSSQGSSLRNLSARRLLFEKNDADSNGTANAVRYSSTPMVRQKSNGRRTSFFNDSVAAFPSPIGKGANVTIHEVPSSQESAVVHHPVQMADIEENLRTRYNIPTTPVHGRTSRRSQSKTPSKMNAAPLSVKNCSVVLESMEIDKDTINTYRRNQLSRLSVNSNVTDKNSVAMVETLPPVNLINEQLGDFDAVKQKLAQCELTSDEEEYGDASQSSEKSVYLESNAEIDTNSNVEIPPTQQEVVSNEEQSMDIEIPPTQSQEISSNIEVPQTQAEAESEESQETPSLNDSISNRVIPVDKLQNLRRTIVNGTQIDNSQMSSTTSSKNTNDERSKITESYLKITKPKGKIKTKKSKKNESRKRTLYNEKESDNEEADSNTQKVPSPAKDPQTEEIEEMQIETPSVDPESQDEQDHVFIRPVTPVKAGRGRPKKKVQNDRQIEDQQTQAKKVSKKSKRAAEESSSDAPEQKRSKKNKKSPAEPQEETRNNKKLPAEPQEETANEEQDEGFDSGNEVDRGNVAEDDDVIYEPNNDRYGFRTRRVAKPYWLFSEHTRQGHMGVRHFDFVKNADVDSNKFKKPANKNVLSTFTDMFDPYKKTQPKKQFKRIKQNSHQIPQQFPESHNRIEKRVRTSREYVQRGAHSIACETSFTVEGPSNDYSALRRLMSDNGTESIASSSSVIVSNSKMDLANIDNVQLEDVGDGLFFGTFTENSKDGIIKLTPGGLKVERKTKKGDIKLLVIAGNVELTVEDVKYPLTHFSHAKINRGSIWGLTNNTAQTAIIYMAKE